MSHERWLRVIDREIEALDRMLKIANHLPADTPYAFANALRTERYALMKKRLMGNERQASAARAQARQTTRPPNPDEPPQNGA